MIARQFFWQDNLQQNAIQLPQITLPKFSGLYKEWLSFRDTFDSLIHKNAALSDVQRFHYLKASLYGDAAKVIASLECSHESYQLAWQLMCDRYDNKALLVNSHIENIFSIPTMPKENPSKLRSLVDGTSKHLAALANLGQNVQSWDSLIIYIICTKLDVGSIREWESHKKQNSMPSLDEFKEFLKRRADIMDAVEHRKNISSSDKTNDNTKFKAISSKNSSSRSLLSADQAKTTRATK